MKQPLEQDPIILKMLEAAHQAASKAIAIRKEAKLNPVLKANKTWVTDADHAAQQVIHQTLSDPSLGNIAFIGEEAPDEIVDGWLKTGRAGKAWVVDPIDGTFAFKRDNNEPWSVSIALQENGQTTHAVMYEAAGDDRDPGHLRGRFFIAAKGQGVKVAACDDTGNLEFKPVKTPLAPAKVMCVGLFNQDNADGKANKGDTHKAVLEHFAKNDFAINHTHCATAGMLSVVDGRMAGYAHGQHLPWDSAAATLIMQEAGCKVGEVPCGLDPKQSIVISAATQALYTDIANAMKQHGVTYALAGNQLVQRAS